MPTPRARMDDIDFHWPGWALQKADKVEDGILGRFEKKHHGPEWFMMKVTDDRIVCEQPKLDISYVFTIRANSRPGTIVSRLEAEWVPRLLTHWEQMPTWRQPINTGSQEFRVSELRTALRARPDEISHKDDGHVEIYISDEKGQHILATVYPNGIINISCVNINRNLSSRITSAIATSFHRR